MQILSAMQSSPFSDTRPSCGKHPLHLVPVLSTQKNPLSKHREQTRHHDSPQKATASAQTSANHRLFRLDPRHQRPSRHCQCRDYWHTSRRWKIHGNEVYPGDISRPIPEALCSHLARIGLFQELVTYVRARHSTCGEHPDYTVRLSGLGEHDGWVGEFVL